MMTNPVPDLALKSRQKCAPKNVSVHHPSLGPGIPRRLVGHINIFNEQISKFTSLDLFPGELVLALF